MAFIPVINAAQQPHRLAGRVLCPEILFQLIDIEFDRCIRDAKDVFRRTVVLLQTKSPGFRVVLGEIQDIANVGATKRINALCIVTNDTDASPRLSPGA